MPNQESAPLDDQRAATQTPEDHAYVNEVAEEHGVSPNAESNASLAAGREETVEKLGEPSPTFVQMPDGTVEPLENVKASQAAGGEASGAYRNGTRA